MSLKPVNIVTYLLLIAGVVTGLIGSSQGNNTVTYIGIVLLIAALILHLVTSRCPHCHRYINRNVNGYCPRCGKKVL